MRKLIKHKKGLGITDLPQVAMYFLLAGVFFAVALVVVANIQSMAVIGGTAALEYNNSNTAANNTLRSVRTALTEIPANWLGILAIVVAAAVVIGIVMNSLYNKRK